VAEVLHFPPSGAPLPPDADARRQALDIRRSFIVEAPAGSGKTGLLIQRFLKLLADESVTEPEQVLAITFTKKATGELRDRVLSHLETAQSDPLPSESDSFAGQTRTLAHAVLERDRQLGWALLDHPQRLNIRTIDSVCAEIARTLPVLSGSGGRLTPTEDAAPLFSEAARRTLLLLGGGDTAFDASLRDLLLHRDGNLADCQSLIADMLCLRDQWGNLIPLTPSELDEDYLEANVLPRLELALDQAITSALARLLRIFPADALASLASLAAEFADLDGYNGEPSPLAICSGCTQPPEAISPHLERWRALIHLLATPSGGTWRTGFNVNHLGCKLERQHKTRLKTLIDQLRDRDDLLLAFENIRALPPARYPADQWSLAKSLFRVLSRALVQLQLVFAERNRCDFTELNLLARHALGEDSGADDLAAALGARLQHLLVDEMQDTSTSQYDLLELLTKSWDGYSQTVFLVGDPRQSIYLFRQARVERFIRAMHAEALGSVRLTPLRLTANFRSQASLVDQFNTDFSLIFPTATSDPHALPYLPAEPTLPPSPIARNVVWHATLLPAPGVSGEPGPSKSSARQQHAHEILTIAREWLSRPLPPDRKSIRDESGNEFPEPWRVAVLVRARNHLEELVSTLNLFNHEHPVAERIPFRAVEIDPLNQRQEVLDLTALTRALLHPADRVAALAVLRAPWCGLPLASLHTLTGADDPAFKDHSILRLMAERGHLLPDDSCQRMTRVWNVMTEAAAKRARLTTAQLVERAWRSLGGDAWLNPAQLNNVHRFFQLLDSLEAESTGLPIDQAVLDDRLQKLFAEPAPIPATIPHVELLTIHKAKGLEWDVVLVPALERGPNRNQARLLTWSETDPTDSSDDRVAPILLAPIQAKGEEVDALTRWLKSIYRGREAAERKRVFYVACTRARQELHLFAAPGISASGEIKPRANTLLDAAWPAAEPHFAAASATAVSEPADLAMAAAADPPRPTLQRLPLTFDPAARFAAARSRKLLYGAAASSTEPIRPLFARPEGSFAARALGNVVHACLEVLAGRILQGESPVELLAEFPSWTPRISAMLRSGGIPPATVDRLTREARAALENVLRNPDGLWLLAPHAKAASEFALTAWTDDHDPAQPAARAASIRVDRVFHAGPEPHAPGDDFLWIVDFKTTDHGPAALNSFLAGQRATYGPQLETYARILARARSKSTGQVRLALYFPAIPRLVWWPASTPVES
jgi:ATP-dependent exoDNAse (exonuclease V) beta subunit